MPKQNAASLAQFKLHDTIKRISIGVTLNKNWLFVTKNIPILKLKNTTYNVIYVISLSLIT